MERGTRRRAIVHAIAEKLRELVVFADGTYTDTLVVEEKMYHFDQIQQYPFCTVTPGMERREYLPDNFKWGFLEVTIRIYVDEENPQERLEQLLYDVEVIIDDNNCLEYWCNGYAHTTELMSILSISTDEGLLAPQGLAEVSLLIQYDLPKNN